MKILWHSHSPAVATGYGTPTALWLPKLRDMGHEVVASAFYGQVQEITSYQGIPVVNSDDGKYGATVLRDLADANGADVIVTLMDTWVLDPAVFRGRRSVHWFPVDTRPLSPLDGQFLRQSEGFPVAMSEYGKTALADAGFYGAAIPYAFDPAVFCPDDEDRAAARRDGNLDGMFAVGINAANVERKAWPEQLTAFAMLWHEHPGEVVLLANTSRRGPVNLDAIVRSLSLPAEAIRWSISGLMGGQGLATWYRSLDVLSACSYAEGFCLPVVEAQAAGTPVIVTGHPPVSEEAGLHGQHVAYELSWSQLHQAWWQRPSVAALHAALEKAFAGRERDPAIVSYVEKYSADEVAPQWAEILDWAAGGSRARKVERGGFSWMVDNGTDDHFGPSDHEAILEPVFRELLGGDGVFLDIGAHIGHWTVRLAGQARKVIAVEANPDTAEILRQNTALNGFGNVTILVAAAWDSDEMLRLESPDGHVRAGQNRTLPGGEGTVRGQLLDDLLADEPEITLVKMDVEGADIHVLNGMRKTLARCRPVMLVERHDIYGYYTGEELLGTLASLGYTWRDAPPCNGVPYLIAEPS